jgi:ABC-type glycerol-3-phosphate transport system permease component
MQLHRTGAGFVPSELPADVASLPIGNHEIHLAGREAHVAVRQDDIARYILAYDAEEHEDPLFNSLLLTLTAGTMLSLMVSLAGYALAGRLAGHLEHVAARADNLSALIPSFRAPA